MGDLRGSRVRCSPIQRSSSSTIGRALLAHRPTMVRRLPADLLLDRVEAGDPPQQRLG